MMRAHRLLMIALLAACGGGRGASRPPPAAPQPVAIDGVLAKLTPRQKVAQLVVPWHGGNYSALDDSAFQSGTRWIDSLEIGGIIVSVGSPYDIATKLNVLQRRSKLPLLVSADLEWGAAMRVIGATAFPMIMAAGATGDERDAYTIGRIAAIEGRAVGIHVNFAPDADVNNNPLNPIINVRSFGEDPQAVSRLVQEYVRGLHEHGMLATLKHFPGHGDTQSDSHIGLPVITAGYPRLDSLELVPFRGGISAGADVVMSAHIAFPSFTGSNDPATLSAAVLSGLLRDSLHFRGLVVTDALTMGAIVAKYGAGEATVRDVGGGLHALRGKPSRFALIVYADENNGTAGQYLTELLRQGGDTVDYFRLWPMSGPLSYDSARAVIARTAATVFLANVRPISSRGNIALPDSLAQLVTATDAARPTVLVSLGSPYLLSQTPTVRCYLIAWSGGQPRAGPFAPPRPGRGPVPGPHPLFGPPTYPT